MNKHVLFGTQQHPEGMSISLLFPSTVPGFQSTQELFAVEVDEVLRVMQFMASLLFKRLCALTPDEFLPVSFKSGKKNSDWPLLKGY